MLAATPILCALLATLKVPSGTFGGGFASAGTTVYHYDAGGRVLAETDAAGGTIREYFYFGNKLIAVGGCARASKACTEWYQTDTLGSVVARTRNAVPDISVLSVRSARHKSHRQSPLNATSGARSCEGGTPLGWWLV